MRIQALCSSTDYDRDARATALPEGPFTAALADGADAHGQQEVPVNRQLEVARQRQEPWRDAWERLREVHGLRPKRSHRTHPDDPMRMVPKNIWSIGWELCRLDDTDWKVLCKAFENAQAAHVLHTATSAFMSVVKPHPDQVDGDDWP